jgi:predicted enzyme related to lactoylglutathione lyase
MPRVVHFEIHAGEPERAITFYEKVFAWTFQKWEGWSSPGRTTSVASTAA